ncbi:hypothetical protein V8C42DRAFT_315095 [Trichoderma barbatum]
MLSEDIVARSGTAWILELLLWCLALRGVRAERLEVQFSYQFRFPKLEVECSAYFSWYNDLHQLILGVSTLCQVSTEN